MKLFFVSFAHLAIIWTALKCTQSKNEKIIILILITLLAPLYESVCMLLQSSNIRVYSWVCIQLIDNQEAFFRCVLFIYLHCTFFEMTPDDRSSLKMSQYMNEYWIFFEITEATLHFLFAIEIKANGTNFVLWNRSSLPLPNELIGERNPFLVGKRTPEI